MPQPTRRRFLTTTLATVAVASTTLHAARKPATAATTPSHPPLDESLFTWHDVRTWPIEGKAFTQTEGDYDRLPAAAKSVVRDVVWKLSKDSAGLTLAFSATTPSIAVRYDLLSENLAMPHMPASGVSGIDLYATDSSSHLRWLGIARPTSQHFVTSLANNIDLAPRTYRLYLPLYNGVSKLEIGLPPSITPTPLPINPNPPIIYYGTSIAQGGCVSRPGMAFTSILSRRLNHPFINLAFSGNGKMEESVGRYICQIQKPAAIVIDCVPNMATAEVAARTEPLVHQLRAAFPAVPILLVEDRENQTFWANASSLKELAIRRAALRTAYDNLTAAKIPNLHYLIGDNLLGSDGEATVDGSHPTDLGSVRYADQLEPLLRKMLA